MKTGLGTEKSSRLNKRNIFLLKCLCFIFVVIFFCEFLLYYFVIIQCRWPKLATTSPHQTPPLKAMFLSDTHLLGEITGHWFDKLRREWQMERAYQSAIWLLQPDLVFILGDLFDEGKWSNYKAWEDDVARFQSMFRHPPNTELIVVVGNHDIGFHYEMTIHKLNRFEKVFNMTSGKVVSRKGINFVLVNSVALEGDNCVICRAAEDQILEVSHQLNCSRTKNHPDILKKCRSANPLPPSAPILLQHYPMYRKSDFECDEEDSASPEEKKVIFKEKYDVLSQKASQKLLWLIQPRLILSGHTHSACRVLHGDIPEISVPSFSWRNRNNPSFIMGLITPEDFSLEKCFLPTENTVIYIYCIAGALLSLCAVTYLLPLKFLKSFYTTKQKPV
ncbi:metallophosphoesterase 1 isoform X1 [Hyla sarda]|uniref:metallophosphoesterase 1 isoform X1 n=1 Tax=Hyla sarda TaxID=327740 RepID=UPI0024C27418|nr:metallophosphoesterase 1 isoform X1 [Hyla sarda]XP_056377523.1 metallophosphoesterase 1 isoform X1 [Hyla sarda]XP_056377524.1 metallophosphoesterase 1 isoform X1 [Hyla sarda]XP_056377525.1 metallophosphoesterase 1 isoform X1 [Hyla sarda]XP_056377526.1 metallophosphoesterase 1 isoform X1 [Hyla sarda]XP_056377527.1 metallophosphoesterase 1 isoform X1 [Hyla sarda]XP_056377529.1 metallophosphoesterase 1 isoform X1 [Hyla sarda]XP_056377530.1 metallophosphoesterase 1 isoform X1 [Hyla sarda]XP_